MAEFSENRHISNLINMSCKVQRLIDFPFFCLCIILQSEDYNVVMKRIQIVSTQKYSFLRFVSSI